jgi:hypothetical protein
LCVGLIADPAARVAGALVWVPDHRRQALDDRERDYGCTVIAPEAITPRVSEPAFTYLAAPPPPIWPAGTVIPAPYLRMLDRLIQGLGASAERLYRDEPRPEAISRRHGAAGPEPVPLLETELIPFSERPAVARSALSCACSG